MRALLRRSNVSHQWQDQLWRDSRDRGEERDSYECFEAFGETQTKPLERQSV